MGQRHNHDCEASLKRLSDYIKANNLRATQERETVVRKLYECGLPATAEQIHEYIIRGYHISKATVYNTLTLLCRCGVLMVSRGEEGRNLYYFPTQNSVEIVCRICGREIKADASGFDDAFASLKARGFVPEWYSLKVTGLCTRCRRKLKLTNNKQ